MGTIFASFQICGIVFLFIASVKSLTSRAMALSPMFFRWMTEILSGPQDFFVWCFFYCDLDFFFCDSDVFRNPSLRGEGDGRVPPTK